MMTTETFKNEITNIRDDMFQELTELNAKRDQLLKDIGKLNTLLALMTEPNEINLEE